ncbi:RNA-binding protein NOB1 isoform X2 [Anabrus simplex]|uniref:RNA-binding protein NOB1 isoform X2 n=1 Tax=Anabrus simplex TaxID=316456 RepID=UPI0035A32D57
MGLVCYSVMELGSNIVTVQAVVDEILNKRQLRNLVVLPYDLQIKDVFPEDIKLITEFSKKSGDYPSLSATDIQVLALTYRLEKEKVGIDHLKKEPVANRVVSLTPHLDDSYKGIAGFYLPAHEYYGEEVCEESSDIYEESSLKKVTQPGIGGKMPSKIQNVVRTDYDSDEESQPAYGEQAFLNDQLSRHDDSENILEDDDNGLDDNDWITPTNIAQMKQEMPFNEEEVGPMEVACITSDFAMQNLLKQIGLKVLSVDGHIIKELRTFILRCYACFKTTSIMTKIFCPHCGNKTLKRVAVSLREDGTQEIHLSARKRITGRGKRFSLPKPQGGKHANNPILCEDQRIPHQRPSRLARTKTNPLDPDYTAGYSPFVMRDVTSRAAVLGIRGTEIKNWMRRNPNEVRKKGSKNK